MVGCPSAGPVPMKSARHRRRGRHCSVAGPWPCHDSVAAAAAEPRASDSSGGVDAAVEMVVAAAAVEQSGAIGWPFLGACPCLAGGHQDGMVPGC